MRVICIDEEFYSVFSSGRKIHCPKVGCEYEVIETITHEGKCYHSLVGFMPNEVWDADQFAQNIRYRRNGISQRKS